MTLRVLVGITALVASMAIGAAADQREKVLADWETNRKRFNAVRYKLSGTVDMKDPTGGGTAAQKKNSPPSAVKPISALVTIDIANKRFRIESSRPLPSIHDRTKWVSDFKVSAYNGKALQTYVPRGKNERPEGEPDLGISTGDLHQLNIEASYWPVFAAHGFVPTRARPMHPDRLPHEYELDEFEQHGTSLHAGRKCVILRTEVVLNGSVELWVDPERGSAIPRRIDFSHKSNPWYRFDVEHQLTQGAWIPKSWVLSYSIGHRVMQVEKMEVVEFQGNPAVSDDDFTIPITSGMLVEEFKYPARGIGLDPQRPATKTSLADSRGRLETLKETGFTTTDGVTLPPERSWLAKWWWLCAVGLLVALTVAVVWYRRSVKRGRVLPG